MTLEALLKRIRREEPKTPAMMAGTALHKILETVVGAADLETAEAEGFRFRFDLDQTLSLTPVREMRGEREWLVGGSPLEVRGRVDGTDGHAVIDHKLTSQFDATTYLDSYQWRLYLAMFGAQRFEYSVFVGSPEPKDTQLIRVQQYHRLTFWRYPEMERDIERLLGQYVEFASVHLQSDLARTA